MASTFEQIFQRLQEQRDVTSEKSPVADSLNRLADAMSVMRRGITSLDESIKEQRIAQGAARNLAQADDVKAQIRTLLELKVAEDAIERERHQRMMDVAESVIPQITDEQLDAIREQRKAYREQQWALKEELRIAEETAKVQKEHSQAIADAEKFAITDKYGTISNVVSGLESKAQDPLSKMLVQGLGRFVKGKEDDKAKVVAQTQADRGRIVDRDLAWKKEDIQEDAAIDAYRKGIKDPGSAVALLKQRDQQVDALAKVGESVESGIVSGNYKGQRNNKGKQHSRKEQADEAVADASPAVKQAISGEWTPVAQTKEEPQPMPAPENAHFKKAETQTTQLVTPNKTPVKNPASVGAFGSKEGAVNLSGIGKLIGGIVGPLSLLAGSFLKFLGPWGIVASALMSFDKLVPIISDGAGALMDLSKLIMPMGVTALIELGATIADIVNRLINIMPGTTNLDTDEGTSQRIKQFREKEDAQNQAAFEVWDKARKANLSKKTTAVDTTTGNGAVVAGKSFTRRETLLTMPSEEAVIKAKSKAAQVANTEQVTASKAQDRREQDQVFRESILAAARNPGTTVIQTANPALAPWFV